MDSLIVKYLSNSATSEELQVLSEWVKNDENKQYFKNFIKLNHNIHLALNEVSLEEAYTKVNTINNKSTNKLRYLNKNKKYLMIAASLAILIGIGSVFHVFNSRSNISTITPITNSSITLELQNGKIININDIDSVIKIGHQTVASQNNIKKQISFIKTNHDVASNERLNKIVIPYGKKYSIVLQDSTIVHLNSGATLEFPSTFSKVNTRMVKLSGEAFFDVHKDQEHPFIVTTDKIQVEVLGTSFNVSSFKNAELSEVVLVEGVVNMTSQNGTQTQILEPGYKGAYSSIDKNITVKAVDTELYTSWIYGKLVFRDKTLNEILNALERNFNIRIINNNRALEKEKLNATFNRDESLERILYYLKEAYNVSYTIDKNKIIIN